MGSALQSYEASGGKAYCGTGGNDKMQLSNASDGYTLTPGTYVLYNMGLDIQNGYLTCPTCNAATGQGVSIVLLGASNKVGSLNINANAVITLNAGTNTTGLNTNLAGVLFYRENEQDDLNVNGVGNQEVTIEGGAAARLEGGFYFPQANASYRGNSSSTCTIIVGGQVTMNGTATFATTGCTQMGTGTPRVRSVALVE
jgi:hypothetical protein